MEALNGIVESIVFKSSDTGYTVIKFRENNIIHTAVGVLPHVKEGQNLKITGSWVNHSQFGKQFKVEECEEIKGLNRKIFIFWDNTGDRTCYGKKNCK